MALKEAQDGDEDLPQELLAILTALAGGNIPVGLVGITADGEPVALAHVSAGGVQVVPAGDADQN